MAPCDAQALIRDLQAQVAYLQSALASLVALGHVTQQQVDHALRIAEVSAGEQFEGASYGGGQYGI